MEAYHGEERRCHPRPFPGCHVSTPYPNPRLRRVLRIISILILLGLALFPLLGVLGCAGMASTTAITYTPNSGFTYNKTTQPWSDEAVNTSASLHVSRTTAQGTEEISASVQSERAVSSEGARTIWDRMWSGLHDIGLVLVGYFSGGAKP